MKIGFENLNKEELIENLKICKTVEDDFFDICSVLSENMGLNDIEVAKFQLSNSNIDFERSVKIIDKRDRVIYGVLILCNHPIKNGLPYHEMDKMFAHALMNLRDINGFLFVIDERLRGCGIDKKMLEFAKDLITDKDYIWVGVDNNLKSHNYWKRLGFTEFLSIPQAKFYLKFLNKSCVKNIYNNIKEYLSLTF